jgi:hypothetical protein
MQRSVVRAHPPLLKAAYAVSVSTDSGCVRGTGAKSSWLGAAEPDFATFYATML